MAKKTWIKVKRGILKPKHRSSLGIRIWLYMYMIDICEWPTGTIPEWMDKSAADELGMPVNTIRKQRRKLEEDGYITCVQGQHSQHITIHKWTDPRKYSGQVLNIEERQEQDQEGEEPLDVGVGESDHPGVSKDDHPEEKQFEGDHEGDHQVIQRMATLPIESQITCHMSVNDSHSLSEDPWNKALVSIGAAYYPKKMYVRNSNWNRYWIMTRYGGVRDGKFIVLCDSEEQRSWLEGRGKSMAESKLRETTDEVVEVEFVVRDG